VQIWQTADDFRHIEKGTASLASFEAEPPCKQNSISYVMHAHHVDARADNVKSPLSANTFRDFYYLYFTVLVAARQIVEFVHAVGAQKTHLVAIALVEKKLHGLQSGDRLSLYEHNIGPVQNVTVLLLKVKQAVSKLLCVVQCAIALCYSLVLQIREINQMHRVETINHVLSQTHVY